MNPSRYDVRYLLERIKRFRGIDGKVTEADLPAITPESIPLVTQQLLHLVNNVPPYYQMYLGRDKTIPTKKSVLHPNAMHTK